MQQPSTVKVVGGADARASGASWRSTGKGPCNRFVMAAVGTRRGKALCQEALAQLTLRFDHRWK